MKSDQLYKGLLCCALALPAAVAVHAQEGDQDLRKCTDAEIRRGDTEDCVVPPTADALEEVVVTGSYIKRDKFSSPSPIEVITAEDIKLQGQPSIAHVVRDLTFTQNTDTVANVLSVGDGLQDSNSSQFNLRGLGTSSTLTLFDGRRSVASTNVTTLVPDIALERVEIVLDGGAATYGTDAVAGVVNFIPIKEFDGIKVSTYYNRDDSGDFEEPKIALLAGKTFEDIGLNFVGAIEYRHKTPLKRSERSEFLRADDDDSLLGHNFITIRGSQVDPNCGANSQGLTDDGKAGSFPFGRPVQTVDLDGDGNADIANELDPNDPDQLALANSCRFEFGEFQDYNRASEDYNVYLDTTYQLNDLVELEFQSSFTYRESETLGSPSVGNLTSNALLSDGNIADNTPFNQLASPFIRLVTYRPFTKVGTLPSHLENGSAPRLDSFYTDRYTVGSKYQFGDSTWSGSTYYSHQKTRSRVQEHRLSFSRLDNAIDGLGGPGCDPDTGTPGVGPCQFFNPFLPGPNSPLNSQELVDSLFVETDFRNQETRFWFIESIVTGEVAELPAGPLAVAFGAQVRHSKRRTIQSDFELSGDDYNTPEPGVNASLKNKVRGVFAEVDVPITDQLGIVAAVRAEEFTTYDLKTTVPKISLRYEPFDNLAIRASIGDGFVAPQLTERGPLSIDNCVEIGVFGASNDPFTGGNTSGDSCASASPTVGAEESRIKSIGFSWKPIEDLEVSVDYQSLEYTDRIVSLASQDLLNRDFGNFIRTFGITDVNGDGDITLGDDFSEAQAAQYLASGLSDPLITRESAGAGQVGGVSRVIRIPDNINANDVRVFDIRARYTLNTDNYGFFIPSFEATGYKEYSYTDFADFGLRTVDGVGKQNAETSVAPPLPRWKMNASLTWFMVNHSAGVRVSYLDGVKFDDESTDDLSSRIDVPANISSHTTIDLRYSYSFEDLLGGQVDFTIGSRNVTDNQPDTLPIAGGLETRLHDPFGRLVYAEIVYEPTF